MPDNRRTFIKYAASATTATLLTSLDIFALENKFAMPKENKFAINIMATKWGYDGTMNEFCKK